MIINTCKKPDQQLQTTADKMFDDQPTRDIQLYYTKTKYLNLVIKNKRIRNFHKIIIFQKLCLYRKLLKICLCIENFSKFVSI